MTGYAKRQCSTDGCKYTVEVKTLNSKTLDLNVKLPAQLRPKELEIRAMLNQLERGKVDMIVGEERQDSGRGELNHDRVRSRYEELKQIAKELDCSDKHLLDSVLAMADVWESPEEEELDDSGWETVRQCIGEAIDGVNEFRQHEGDILERDFVKHVDLIEERLGLIPQYEQERIETAKERIQHYFAENAIKEIDPNRFEQELIYYLEKLDITEEKIRLQKHIDYFRQTMAQEPSCGKKLGFVAQEMGREINTTGSKANHVEIQKLVVQMKDELEKIKEQLGNIL